MAFDCINSWSLLFCLFSSKFECFVHDLNKPDDHLQGQICPWCFLSLWIFISRFVVKARCRNSLCEFSIVPSSSTLH